MRFDVRIGQRRLDFTKLLADAEIELIGIRRLELVREHPDCAAVESLADEELAQCLRIVAVGRRRRAQTGRECL